MSTLIPTGFDNITVLRGSKYVGIWDWEDTDFTGNTATIKIKNIHEQFKDVKNVYEVGVATVCPLDVDNNPYINRIQIELSKEDTLKFAIPDEEEFSFDDESGYYSILNITLDDGTVVLTANVKVVNSLEAETLNFLLDEKDEAIIINQKLDNLDAYSLDFITQRDTYLQTLSDAQTNIDAQVEDITTKHGEINQIKDDVIALKGQVETIFDNFDDRYLGAFDTAPILDNDGEALAVGAIYLNTVDKELKFYNGVSWDSPVAAAQTYAQQASQSASDANASKLAAKTSEDNAKASEEIVIQKADDILELANIVQGLAQDGGLPILKLDIDGATDIGANLVDTDLFVVDDGANGTNRKSAISRIWTYISGKLTGAISTVLTSNLTASKVLISDASGKIAVSGVSSTTLGYLDATSSVQTQLNNKVNIADIKNDLVSIDTNKPLSAKQGKVLKDAIDNINAILTSDDTTLDQMQEIVNYIKQNKTTLEALGISNIAGLQSALDAKQATITTGSLAVSTLDIDGATDIGANLVDTDLFVVDDGANGTNRKSAISRIWTYISGKLTGAISTVLTSNLTASKVLISDASGKIAVSGVSSTTLGYLDATSSVQTQLNAKATLASPALTGTPKINGYNISPFTGFKNYIINGKKVVNKRGLTSTDNSYNQDRWYKAGNNWYQGIEGDNNLISGNVYTLSWVGAATAGYYVGTATSATINSQTFTSISNGGNFTLTISAGQNLWVKFASDSTGSTFNYVQLEDGNIATPFENRPYGLELSLCQRYYETNGSARCEEFRNLTINITQYGSVRFITQKRAIPTIVIYSDNLNNVNQVAQNDGVNTPCSVASTGDTGFRLSWTSSSGRSGASFNYIAAAEL